MVRFRIVSGPGAGEARPLTGFPAIVGRSASASIRFEDQGVWDRHFEVAINADSGFTLRAFPNASTYVNGTAVEQAVLKLGDLVEFGRFKIEFLLEETRMRPSTLREAVTWGMLVAVFLAQTACIAWMVSR
ncbi:MAG: FHA domain-containing protein [Verrucomicrobia bacterium]|jgi:pSer/pThr/pTyr-binding forkhead associated (FHA) protein|nr:FHA domain-containing protein [Verrucomicrobiota bacterium]